MLTVGGKKKTKFQTLAGMPNTHSMAGTPSSNTLVGMPNTHSMAGMPSTKQLNGGWGADHPGRIENRKPTLLQKLKSEYIKDPQEKRKEGQLRLGQDDPSAGFLKEKLAVNGSVVYEKNGLCLKGEEYGASPSDGQFYGMRNGKRGWFTVEGAEGGKGGKSTPVSAMELDVVVDVFWDMDTHQLKQYKKRVLVILPDKTKPELAPEVEPTESVVFTAVKLQDEL